MSAFLKDIVEGRRHRVSSEGYELGENIPAQRKVPLVPFISNNFLVCEIKRRSPSRGSISIGLDAVKQAHYYVQSKVTSVSVVTEQDYFDGCLADLIAVKQSYPTLSVLRKDFLLEKQDIDISYRAGADAVLLLANGFTKGKLKSIYEYAISLGLEVLVEIHDMNDLQKARSVQPRLTGINSRNLTTFRVDKTLPAVLKAEIDWPTKLLFESGILSVEDVAFAKSAGFDGVLVGEAVVRKPELVRPLQQILETKISRFWEKIFHLKNIYSRSSRPIIKVCGITCRDDAELAISLGADILGFILAPSPRQVNKDLIIDLADLAVIKVGVVVNDSNEAKELVENGNLDAIQYHGDEDPQICFKLGFPYYKAIQINNHDSLKRRSLYNCPRVLVDSYDFNKRGGTGQRINSELLPKGKNSQPLWLAGGINPENVVDVIKDELPELIDISSGLERSVGKKDTLKLKEFFKQINMEIGN